MSFRVRARRSTIIRALALTATAVVVSTTAWVSPAAAHGNVVDPPSRNYGCLERWGTRHMAPEMASVDPMCHQAWQADPSTMWNQNGLFREGVGGNHQAAIPDGTLCSGGQTQGGRYNSLDVPGNWQAKNVANSFSVRLFDQASHGADYLRVYVTKQGFNPLTQRLRWSDLELRNEIGNTPAARWDQAQGGVSINVPVSAPGRTGRHVVYMIWQASHFDQSYYLCSDVNFGGTPSTPSPTPGDPSPTPGNPSPTPGDPTPTPPDTSPTPSVSPSVPSSPAPGNGACTATYTTTSQWQGGFQGEVRITAGSSALTGWRSDLSFPGGQRIQQAWNATVVPTGSSFSASNATYNGRLAAGASTTFGFIGSSTGTTPVTAQVSCSGS